MEEGLLNRDGGLINAIIQEDEMKIDRPEDSFELSDVEVETLRRAAAQRGMMFAPERRHYTTAELNTYGMVREAYNTPELQAMGIGNNKVVTSFDSVTEMARDKLLVDAPFASQIRKWQIPVDVCEWRVFITEFPPNTFVEPHVHPENTTEQPGGSLRTILHGSLLYSEKVFKPGDWFFIPNGVPYSFTSDKDSATVVMYTYAFFAVSEGNRFSSPLELEKQSTG